MLEYGETYLKDNERILDAMYQRMSPEAVELAKLMAAEDLEDIELEEGEFEDA